MLHRRIAILLIVSMLASTGMARWFHVATAHGPAETAASEPGVVAVQVAGHGCSHAGCNAPALPADVPSQPDSDDQHDEDRQPEPADDCGICGDLKRHMDAGPSLALPAVLPASPPMVWRHDAAVTTCWMPLRPIEARGPPIALA